VTVERETPKSCATSTREKLGLNRDAVRYFDPFYALFSFHGWNSAAPGIVGA
jgi:hypothetical protein